MNSPTQEQKNRADLKISPQNLSVEGSAAYSPIFLSAAANLFSGGGSFRTSLNLSKAWSHVKSLQGVYAEVSKESAYQNGQTFKPGVSTNLGYDTEIGQGRLNVNVGKTEKQNPTLRAGYNTELFGGNLDINGTTGQSNEPAKLNINWSKRF